MSKPIPAVAAGGGYFEVQPSQNPYEGSSKFPGMNGVGFFCAPMDDAPDSIAIRAHEYGHLITERKGIIPESFVHDATIDPEIGSVWAQAIADVVVNEHMKFMGIKEVMNLPMPLEDIYSRELPNYVKYACYLRSRSLMHPSPDGRYKPPKPATATEIAFVKNIFEQLRARACCLRVEKGSGLKSRLKFLMNAGRHLAAVFGNEGLPGGLAPPEARPSMEGEDGAKGAGMEKFITSLLRPIDSFIRWGSMDMMTVPFTKSILPKLKSRKVIAGYVGAFRYIHRALLPSGDGNCFGYFVKRRAGSVLIDASGSMGLSDQDVEEIAMTIPAGIIAKYGSLPRSSRSGRLVIIGKDGKLAKYYDHADTTGGGNVVDYPALCWLAKQKKPRVWISDGHVTGVGDAGGAVNLELDVQRICTMGKIIRLNSMREVRQYLTSGVVFNMAEME